ncbi:MAG: response regulator [Candidatus Nanopelagicales bacterium]|jgi:DNA-binding NarL/FixJ family response regulator
MLGRSLLVVEDNALLRELLASALEARDFVVHTAASIADAKRCVARFDPDGAILDIELGPGPNGFDFADMLHEVSPHTAIVFLTNLPDPRFADRGADGLPTGFAYLRKTALSNIDSLVEALDDAMRGRDLRRHRHDQDKGRPLAALTQKQIDVMYLAADGKTNAQIAADREISIKAVEDILSRAASALGIDAAQDGNVRVAAVRKFLEGIGAPASIEHDNRALK